MTTDTAPFRPIVTGSQPANATAHRGNSYTRARAQPHKTPPRH